MQIWVRLKKGGVTVKTKYSLSEGGHFVKFVLDDESADFADFGCNGEQWTVELYGSSVPNSGRDVYTAWFYEDLDRTGSGPCQMVDIGTCNWTYSDALLWR